MQTPVPAQYLADPALRRGLDLLLVGYRRHRIIADEDLQIEGFGAAHHRVLYFVGEAGEMSPKALMSLLGISKQSLGRVVTSLKERSLIHERASVMDRRQKFLHLTEAGRELERRLYASAEARMRQVYNEAGQSAVEGFWNVLTNLMGEDGRAAYDSFDAKRVSRSFASKPRG